jgi:hypothetical protein
VAREITGRRRGNPRPIITALYWPRFPLLSQPFRFAALALASSLVGTENDAQIPKYLARFFKHTREAISASWLVEIVVSSYAILLYSYSTSDPLKTILVYFKGLSTALILLPTELLARDFRFLEGLWHASVEVLHRAWWVSNEPSPRITQGELDLLLEVHTTLQKVSCMMCPDLHMQTEVPCGSIRGRLNMLECYLTFYFDYYLAILHSGPDNQTGLLAAVETSLRETLEQITLLATQFHCPRALVSQASKNLREFGTRFSASTNIVLSSETQFVDVKLALVYGWARVVENVLAQARTVANGINPEHVAPANIGLVYSSNVLLHLCRLVSPYYSKQLSGLSITRALFWSGLIQTKHVDSNGTYPHEYKLSLQSQRSDSC